MFEKIRSTNYYKIAGFCGYIASAISILLLKWMIDAGPFGFVILIFWIGFISFMALIFAALETRARMESEIIQYPNTNIFADIGYIAWILSSIGVVILFLIILFSLPLFVS